MVRFNGRQTLNNKKMIKYFQVKKRQRGPSPYAEVYYREKANRKINTFITERYISNKKPVLILGDGDSGKTHSLMKFFNHAELIWRKKPSPIMLSATQPVMQWVEQKCVVEWVGKNEWKSLKPFERSQKVIDYCKEKKPIVFVDDAHKLTGRKLQLAKQCLLSNVFILTALTENKLPPSIRDVVIRRGPQTFAMSTKVAYDATSAFAWIFVFAAFLGGFPEVALMAGGFQLLANGRRGSNST